MVRVHHISSFSAGDELFTRFLELHEQIKGDDYYYYPESESHRGLIDYYASRPDYRFELILAENADGVAAGRVMVGRCSAWDRAFFGLFECVDDDLCFSRLMETACEVARGLRVKQLHGPIDFNSIHNWQFLLSSDGPQRWVGDPYHPPHYVRLFKDAGWEVCEQSVSGVVKEKGNRYLIDSTPFILEDLEQEGYQIVHRGDLPDEDLVRMVWEIVDESFNAELHHYVSVEHDLFRHISNKLLAHLTDPHSITMCLKDGEAVGFSVSHTNHIEKLCNPDGDKRRPEGHPATGQQFAVQTTAVRISEQCGLAYPGLLTDLACHTQERYGHRLAWRRVNLRNPGTRPHRKKSEITHEYASFARQVA